MTFLVAATLTAQISSINTCVLSVYSQAPAPFGFTLAATSAPQLCTIVPFVEFPTAVPSSIVQVLTAAPSQLTCFPLDLACELTLPQWTNLVALLIAIVAIILLVLACYCCCGACISCMEVFATFGVKRSITQGNQQKRLASAQKAEQTRSGATATQSATQTSSSGL